MSALREKQREDCVDAAACKGRADAGAFQVVFLCRLVRLTRLNHQPQQFPLIPCQVSSFLAQHCS